MNPRPLESKSQNDRRDCLIIGCGHGLIGCSCCHPKSQFVCVDLFPDCEPDFACDITEQDKFAKILKKKFHPFSYIISEFLPIGLHAIFLNLQKHLKDDGYFIIIGFVLPDLINLLQPNDFLWIGTDINHTQKVAIISKNKSATDLVLNNTIQPYLHSFFNSKDISFIQLQVTKDLKNKAHELTQFLWQIRRDLPIDIIWQSLLNVKEDPLTLKKLNTIAASYAPGFFRRHLSTNGKTTGMNLLNNYLAKLPNENYQPKKNELLAILELINNRKDRIFYSLNPSRSAKGKTSKIFTEITIKIIKQLISVNLPPEEAKTKSHHRHSRENAVSSG